MTGPCLVPEGVVLESLCTVCWAAVRVDDLRVKNNVRC